MGLSWPLGITHCVLQGNTAHFTGNKSFIDQACSVKMAGYWLASLFLGSKETTISNEITFSSDPTAVTSC